jgi:sugar-specific transcriptional regulator TrmB
MQEEDQARTQLLMNLGLTLIQAKIYLTLAKLEEAGVKKISKTSKIARSDVYRVIPSLEEEGLVEKILAAPTVYKAIPIRECLEKLLKNKKNEFNEIECQTNLVLNNMLNEESQEFYQKDTQFKITSEWTLLNKMHKNLITSTKKSIDITMPRKFFFRLLDSQSVYLKEALKRGVKIRLLLQCNENVYLKDEHLSKFFNEIEFVSCCDLFAMHIFDGKDITLNIATGDGVPCLWSNDVHVASIAKVYFETLWGTATDKKPAPLTTSQ